MRRTVVVAALLIVPAGCSRQGEGPAPSPVEEEKPAAPPRLVVHTDLPRARRLAVESGKPLLVFSVLGDWKRHC